MSGKLSFEQKLYSYENHSLLQRIFSIIKFIVFSFLIYELFEVTFYSLEDLVNFHLSC
jgi:hypothetical protein